MCCVVVFGLAGCVAVCVVTVGCRCCGSYSVVGICCAVSPVAVIVVAEAFCSGLGKLVERIIAVADCLLFCGFGCDVAGFVKAVLLFA